MLTQQLGKICRAVASLRGRGGGNSTVKHKINKNLANSLWTGNWASLGLGSGLKQHLGGCKPMGRALFHDKEFENEFDKGFNDEFDLQMSSVLDEITIGSNTSPREINLYKDARTKQIMELLNLGNVEAAIDEFILIVNEYPLRQLPQYYLTEVIREFLKHQQRGAFAYPKNIVQLLFERGILSVQVCNSFVARREIIVALDQMATKPDGFYNWTAFDGPFRGYFNAVIKLRGIDFARDLALCFLRQMQPGNMAVAYNAWILCLSHNPKVPGTIKLAREFLEEMLQMKLMPSPRACHFVITGTLYERVGGEIVQDKLKQAMAIFRAMLPVVGALPRETYVALINFLDAESSGCPLNYRNVCDVFNHMLEKKSTPTLLLYNIALKNYAKLASDRSSYEQPMEVKNLDELIEEEKELVTGTWHLHRMVHIWHHMKMNGVKPDTFTLNAFMELFSNCDRSNQFWVLPAMKARMKLLVNSGAKPNSVTMLSLINVYGKCNDLKGMNGVLRDALEMGIVLDNHTLATAIDHSLRLKDVDSALLWIETLTGPKYNLVPDIPNLSLFVDVYSRLNDVEKMDKFWQLCCKPKMEASGELVPPKLTLQTYQRAINSYANVIRALSSRSRPADTKDILWRIKLIFRRLEGEDFTNPDTFSYNAYLKGHIAYLMSPQGKANFRESYAMTKEVYDSLISKPDLRPDQNTFSAILNAIAHLLFRKPMHSAQLLNDSENILFDMKRFKITPNLHVVSIMIKLAGSAGRLIQMHSHYEQFLEMVKHLRFNPTELLPVFNTYLNFLNIHNKASYDGVIASMAQCKVTPDAITYRIWLKGLDRSRANVQRMWEVLDHLNSQAPPIRIDGGFLIMVADVFYNAAGIQDMNQAVTLLLEHHMKSSNLDLLRPTFYLDLLKKVMIPFSLLNSVNQLKFAHRWLIVLANFPPSKSDKHIKQAYELMVSSFDPLSHHWKKSPEVLETLNSIKASHIDALLQSPA